ncbi:type VI secretion system ATPase TssH [Dyella sp.]|uniref:type VI secretion system ATPase TssH n=1 Tax=Dyella sp. TaxID=1869338 RepID=UPI002D791DD2|nr:type VI secretion system ATPase TssH [Dyella sp.]HET6432034.1 type VI secretion system ATPase TssH [Dyella sp.]
MADISRSALFGKLNKIAYRGIESATVFCKLRGNPYIELVHWIHQILQLQDSDLHHIIKQFNLNPSNLVRDVTDALDRLPRGSSSISDISSNVEESVERAWVFATLMFGEAQVRTGYLVVGILQTRHLRNVLVGISKEFEKIKLDTLTDQFAEVVGGSPEDNQTASDGFKMGGAVPGEASGAMGPAQMGKQEALKQFTVDLTEQARSGKIDPIVGRDEEIRQVVDILMRRRQNNPMLVGEAGVGKTAVVEGFALRIVQGDVPPQLKDVELRTLDVGLLQAGASMKGEFENRLRQVIEEVQSSPKPIILFIDEAHTLVGAGGAAGTGDAANLLKPALARGKLRTIAATTWAEYKKYIEKDPALTRRFQVVQVDEPDEEKAIGMMRGMAGTLEEHHKIGVLDEALQAAVKLSHRYIPARQLPDKAVSLLDTACARVAISQSAVPAEVEDSRSKIRGLEIELEIIGREKASGWDVAAREAATKAKIEGERGRLDELEKRWKSEQELVAKILELRKAARKEGDDEKLRATTAELHKLQGQTPLIFPTVDAQAVAAVVGEWTGIPVGRMVNDEIQTVLKLGDSLSQRVIGQRHGLDMIARRIQTSRAGLADTRKPIGVFLLAGPSGVGKTETALTLAETLYGGEQNLITINMSEFQEAHTVSTLKGAPPGYVGYGEGGVLTEAVRRKPYSVVLLDEVEKAHSDVHEIFFQVFDKGVMEDGEGRMIDFKNTLILLTSNVGSDLIATMCKDPQLMPEPEAIATALRPALLKVFPAALLGRLVTIPYYPLSDEIMGSIVKLQLGRVVRRVSDAHGIPLEYDDKVVKLIVSRCTEVESGGRMIDAILTNTLLPRISQELLVRMGDANPVKRVKITAPADDFEYAFE